MDPLLSNKFYSLLNNQNKKPSNGKQNDGVLTLECVNFRTIKMGSLSSWLLFVWLCAVNRTLWHTLSHLILKIISSELNPKSLLRARKCFKVFHCHPETDTIPMNMKMKCSLRRSYLVIMTFLPSISLECSFC